MESINDKIVMAQILAHCVTEKDPDIVNDMVWAHADGLRFRRLQNIMRGHCSLATSLSFDIVAEERQLDEDIGVLELLLGGDKDEENN